jgi:uncharacterized protein (DUF2235 family)
MALYAFDGTGNEDKADDEKHGFDSNVLDFFRAYDDPAANDDPKKELGSLYLKGIGKAARTFAGDKVAEAFGFGGHKRIRQMMERLENNFEAGDQTIDVIGFSRGAALAISFANEIAKKLPTVSIRFIGVWDIVGEFGVAGEHINAGHNLNMPPNVLHCYHAMALDECRAFFQLTRLAGSGVNEAGRLIEVWFRGVHSDVGGGNGNFGLNWIALNWMYENAKRHNLGMSQEKIASNLKRQTASPLISEHKVAAGPERKIRTADLLHASVQLDPTVDKRQRNDPKIPLARIDDAGVVTPVDATVKV